MFLCGGFRLRVRRATAHALTYKVTCPTNRLQQEWDERLRDPE